MWFPRSRKVVKTRSSWLNCALRDDEAVYWVSIGHYEALAIGNWLYWVSRGHLCLYILHKVEIWTGVTDAWLTHSLTTLKDRATQLHIKYKSGALVTQKLHLYSYKKTQIPILIFNNILIIETLVSWETPKILLGGFLPANGVHPPGPPSLFTEIHFDVKIHLA